MRNLVGKIALVTGGLTGIARATAIALAGEGSRLVVSGRHNDAGIALTDELRGRGAEAKFIQADVRRDEDVRSLVDKTCRASALALAAAGAQVLVHCGRGANETDAVVGEIRNTGGRGDAVATGLERADGPHKLATLARDIMGDRLDILVANAGVSKSATIEDTTMEDFDRLFAVNVRAPFFLDIVRVADGLLAEH